MNTPARSSICFWLSLIGFTAVILLLAESSLSKARAVDARTITENGTNILAIGIDARDFSVVRFYLSGSNVLELRPDDLLHRDRRVLGPNQPLRESERKNLLQFLHDNMTVTAGNAPMVLSNLVRLRFIEELDIGR